MRIEITSPRLTAYVTQLARLKPYIVQRQIIRPALSKSAAVWRSTLRSLVVGEDRGVSPLSRTPKLKDVLSVRVFARRDKAPSAIMVVGTRSVRRERTRTSPGGRGLAGNQPPASVRLRFLSGTKVRYTHGGLVRSHSRAFHARGRLFRQAGARRGQITDRRIPQDLEARAEAPAEQVFTAHYNARARAAISVDGGRLVRA